jgi:uncharacterized membrane protein YphA (DoxX/SURF4 family)
MERGRRADGSLTFMEQLKPGYPKALDLGLRAIIGGAFVYAGWAKMGDPSGLADSVASFAILPRGLVTPFALALPIFEIAAGAMTLVQWPGRIGALALLTLAGVFCFGLTQAIARRLNVNCGCFGPSATTINPWLDLSRNLLTVVGCAILYRPNGLNHILLTVWSRGRRSV